MGNGIALALAGHLENPVARSLQSLRKFVRRENICRVHHVAPPLRVVRQPDVLLRTPFRHRFYAACSTGTAAASFRLARHLDFRPFAMSRFHSSDTGGLPRFLVAFASEAIPG